MNETNRRHFSRKSTETDIQVFILPANSRKREDSCEIIPAKMVNQSEEGLYLEIDRDLEPGTNVTIRLDGTQKILPAKSAYRVHAGRIIWCRKVNDEPIRFGIGLKILRKSVQADILTSRFGPSAAGSAGD